MYVRCFLTCTKYFETYPSVIFQTIKLRQNKDLVSWHTHFNYVSVGTTLEMNIMFVLCYVFNLLKTKISPYRAVNTFHHGYKKNQSVNDV